METEELVRRCKDGDRGALALLYQTYSGRLFRLCADIVKDKDAAQDLLHDGFIIIFSSIGSLRSPARLEAWMSRVMANLAVKYLNDRKNRPVAGTVADVHAAPSADGNVVQSLHAEDSLGAGLCLACTADTLRADALVESVDALCRIAGSGSAVAVEPSPVMADVSPADTSCVNVTTKSHDGWLLGFSSMMERASDVIMPRIIEVIEHAVGSGTRVEIETWEQLVHYLTYDVGESLDPIERDVLLRIALMNSGKIVTHKNYEKPLQLGLNFNRRLSDRWSLDMGLRVTRHTTNMLTGSSDTTNISERQRIFYVGIPVNATYTFMRRGRMSAYLTAGMAVDVPFSAKSDKLYNIDGKTEFSRSVSLGFTGLQWSVGAGVGMAYEIAPHLELFFSPRITWYIPNGSKAETQWTGKPLQISLPFGIRISY